MTSIATKGDAPVFCGEGESFLSLGDQRFLRSYPGTREQLAILRRVEGALFGGHVPSLDDTPSETVEDAIANAAWTIEDTAGSDGTSVVTRQMIEALTTGLRHNVFNYNQLPWLVDAYMTPLHFHPSEQPQVQDALQGSLASYYSIHDTHRRQVVDTVLMHPSLYVGGRELVGDTIKYYGKEIRVRGLSNKKRKYWVELELGFGMVYNEDGTPIGGIDVHPGTTDYGSDQPKYVDLIQPDRLMEARTGRSHDAYKDDWQQFLREIPAFFQGKKRWYRKKRLLVDDYDPTPSPSPNIYPLELKHTLWRLMRRSPPKTQEAVEYFIDTYGEKDSVALFQALDGSGDLIEKLKRRTEAFLNEHNKMNGWNTEEKRNFVHHMISQFADLETFSMEMAIFSASPSEISTAQIGERINFVVPFVRMLAKEACETISASDSFDQMAHAVVHHAFAANSLSRIMFRLQELYGYRKSKTKGTFSPHELDEIQAMRALFPTAELASDVRYLDWLMKAMVNQKDISIDDERKWLRSFLSYVVSQEIYEAKGAQVYAGPQELEVHRLAGALLSLSKEGYIPVGSTVLILGGGPATRVEGPALDEFRRSLGVNGATMKIIASDLRAQTSRYDDASFSQAAIEQLPFKEKSADVVVLHGSVLNNMRNFSEQIRYVTELIRVMKDGAILIVETGSSEPIADLNERLGRMKAFNAKFPEQPFGAIDFIKRYAGFSPNPEEEVGAIIFPYPIMAFLHKLVGLRLLSPTDDPRAFQTLMGKLQDQAFLEEQSKIADAHKAPFVLAGIGEDGANTRATYIFKLDGQREGGLSDLMRFLVSPAVAGGEKKGV